MKRLVNDKKQELLDNLLESVSVDKEGNMEVGKNLGVDGKLTINSASDLKTKDGTSIGGGAIYEQPKVVGKDLYLPDGFTDRYLKGEVNGVLIDTPTQYLITNHFVYYAFYEGSLSCVIFPVDDTGKIDANNEKILSLASWVEYGDSTKLFGSVPSDLTKDFATGLINQGGTTFYGALKNGYFGFFNALFSSQSTEFLLLQSGNVTSSVDVPEDFATRSQHIDLGDIAKKQATLYRHTITIVGPNGDLSMNIDTESNAKMDSITDLIAKFKGNKLGCYCVSGSNENMAIYTNITFGSTSAECILSGRNFKGAILTGDKLTTVFGSTMEVKDTITAM